MDDFGDFLQAPVKESLPVKPARQGGVKQPIDLNAKILSSFDLSGSNQRANFKFQQPARHAGKRPQGAPVKQSSSSADWKNLSLESEEFMAPVTAPNVYAHQQNQTGFPQGNQNLNLHPIDRSGVGHNQQFVQPTLAGTYNQTNVKHNVPGTWQGVTATGPSVNAIPPGAVMPPSYQSIIQPNAFPDTALKYPSHQNSNPHLMPGHQSHLNFQEARQTRPFPAGAVFHPPAHASIPPINTLPVWMTNPNLIPQLYKEVLNHCATSNSFADTSLLYPIFLSSGLPKDVLGHIWTAVNQSSPGQLTFTEVYTALALIALAQKGEMDLTVRYVMRLPAAPMPDIKLPQKNNSALNELVNLQAPVVNPTNQTTGLVIQPLVPVQPKPVSSNSADAFTDFQSFSAFESVKVENAPASDDFDDFQSFSTFSGAEKVQTASYPDRDIMNSPKSISTTDLSPQRPKQLLGGIDFKKFDDTSSKVLHSAARRLNIGSQQPKKMNPMEMKTNNDDFDDFKSAEQVPVPKQDGNLFTSFPGFDNTTSNASISVQPSIIVDKNDKYSVFRELNPVSSQKTNASSNAESDGGDKYSVLRGVEIGSTNELAVEDDFSNFQSVPPVPGFAPEAFQKSFISNNMSKADDIQSVTSLELPSLSKTILSNSIGNGIPSKSSEDLFFSASTTSLPTPNIFAEKASDPILFSSNPLKSSADDGLYDLDDPISPVFQKKPVVTASPKEPPPFKVKLAKIRARISESDDDFGDFSTAPPPIDDNIDRHDLDLEPEEGDSSLVDFDAFGHFEEAKVEAHKKKEAMFKRTSEDATAFSEFVKSSVVDLKPAHSNESTTSTSNQADQSCGEEDSSITEHKINDDTSSFETGSTDTERKNDTKPAAWSLEPTVFEAEPAYSFKPEPAEWEEEGNQIKARMEGSSNPTEVFVDHWSRCLTTCKDIIVSTGDIFAALNSPAVCHEVVNSIRGKEFIACTSEVCGVARRIRKGMEIIRLTDDDLVLLLKEIEIAWNNLLGFCPYTPSVHKTPEHRGRSNSEGPVCSTCSLCLLDTESTDVTGLEYCGRFYHSPCANLWLNQIAPILPRLEVPAMS